MQNITLTVDGSCPLNPGAGGWAFLLRSDEHSVEQSGGYAQTTNNRAELQAAVEGLNVLEQPSDILLVSDSKYLLDGVSSGRHKWRTNSWMITRHRRTYPLVNLNLWLKLDEMAAKHMIVGQWIRSRSPNRDHERCEQLASAQAAQFPYTSRWAGLAAKIRARRAYQPLPAA